MLRCRFEYSDFFGILRGLCMGCDFGDLIEINEVLAGCLQEVSADLELLGIQGNRDGLIEVRI